jgi:hypothetical protein
VHEIGSGTYVPSDGPVAIKGVAGHRLQTIDPTGDGTVVEDN